MALIKCTKCGHTVSDKALKCPQCGYAMNNSKHKSRPKKVKRIIMFISFVVVILGSIVWLCFDNNGDGFSKELIAATHRYDEIRSFQDGMAPVCKNGMWGYIDKQGKERIPCIYDYVNEDLGGEPLRYFNEGLVAVCKDEKWGFVNKEGKQVVHYKYGFVGDFSEGLASVGNGDDGFYGYIDKFGNQVISCDKYYILDGSFNDGLAVVGRVGQRITYGYIDKTGKEVIPLKYASAKCFSEGLAAVKIDINSNKWTIIDTKGNPVFSYQCDEIKPCSNGLFAVGRYALSDGGDILWGFIDKTGREVVPLKYYTYWYEGNEIVNFSDGFVRVRFDEESCCKFLDVKGNVRFGEYKAMGSFSEGLAAVCRGDKLGFIDVNGNEVIPCKYSPIVTSFSEGLAVVSLYEQIGFVDKYGKDTFGDVN